MADQAIHEESLKQLAGATSQVLEVAPAALALAALDHTGESLDPYLAHLQELVTETGLAAADGAPPQRALRRAFCERFDYRGDSETYEDVQNADLIRVIRRRRGLPVALSILYLHAARAQGWSAAGLNFPMHFLIRVDAYGRRDVIDPFQGGRSLSADEIRRLLKRVAGEDAELERGYFDEVDDRQVLLRLQNNIKFRAVRDGDFTRAHEIVRRMLLFAPDHVPLWRDASVTSFQVGEVRRAVKLAEAYFERAPDSATRNDAARLLQRLQRNVN